MILDNLLVFIGKYNDLSLKVLFFGWCYHLLTFPRHKEVFKHGENFLYK